MFIEREALGNATVRPGSVAGRRVPPGGRHTPYVLPRQCGSCGEIASEAANREREVVLTHTLEQIIDREVEALLRELAAAELMAWLEHNAFHLQAWGDLEGQLTAAGNDEQRASAAVGFLDSASASGLTIYILRVSETRSLEVLAASGPGAKRVSFADPLLEKPEVKHDKAPWRAIRCYEQLLSQGGERVDAYAKEVG